MGASVDHRRAGLRVRHARGPRIFRKPNKRMAPQVGLEPTTLRLTAGCSAIELLRSVVKQIVASIITSAGNAQKASVPEFCWLRPHANQSKGKVLDVPASAHACSRLGAHVLSHFC